MNRLSLKQLVATVALLSAAALVLMTTFAARAAPTAEAKLQFPVRVHDGGSFGGSGGGIDTYAEALLASDGRLEVGSVVKPHRSMLGACAHVAVYLFDGAGQQVGRYGMPDGHQFCVKGSLVGGGLRHDQLPPQQVPADVMLKVRRISVISRPVQGPVRFSVQDALDAAKTAVTIISLF
jgi:hypothetical protein